MRIDAMKNLVFFISYQIEHFLTAKRGEAELI